MDNLFIEELVHMQFRQLSDCCSQVNRLVTANFLMSNISNGKVTIVEGVSSKARHALCADGVFYGVQELQVRLLEYILQELPINEVVHPLNTVIPRRFLFVLLRSSAWC